MIGQPRRSVLYVPTNNLRALNKAPTLDCDVIIYDFEDAVLNDQKSKARDDLAEHFRSQAHHCEVVIRINRVSSAAFYDDLEWLAGSDSIDKVDALLLPKVKTLSELALLKRLLSDINVKTPVWLLIETVEAVLNLAELVDFMDQGSAIVLGSEDLSIQMGINPTPGRLGLLPILTQLVLHGRQAKLSIIDAIYPNIDNTLGLNQSCEQACNLGFDGKSLIHPNQIDIANQIFSPTPIQVERAKQILRALEKGKGEE